MPKEKSNELAVVETSGNIMSTMPAYLAGPAPQVLRGGEQVEAGDFVIPRLSICSKQSPQFDENNEKYIPGLKLGVFFNTVSREIYGPSVYAVPLLETKSRAIFRPYGEDGPPICISSDGKQGDGDPGGECAKCPERQFTKDKDGKSVKPHCSEQLNFAVLILPSAAAPIDNVWTAIPRIDTISILGFKSTSIGSAKTWITLLRLRNRDWFAGVYKLTSVLQTDGKNSWHIPLCENAGWLSEAGFKFCEPAYESLRSMLASGRAKIDDSSEREPGDERSYGEAD